MPWLELGAAALSLIALIVVWRAWRQVRALNANMERLAATLHETRPPPSQNEDERQTAP
ncbi:MAG: hypothetical protein BroJett039_00370 [Chloroflexota bacterium]|nr:MAG: hypothetical protein BroJett039_00370 [Chloroflexota bacterium]